MTSKKAQNIPIADILSFYTPQTLHAYPPPLLKQHLHDLRTLINFCQSEVPQQCTELRKKANEIQKIITQVDKSSAQTQSEFLNRPAANPELAYRILSLSAPPLISSKPTPKLLKELKLKFMESTNLSLAEWPIFLRKEKNALAISVAQQPGEVMLGLQQKNFSTQLEWVILQASVGGQRSPELTNFFLFFCRQSQRKDFEHSEHLIDNIKKLLFNLPIVVIYLQLTKIWRSFDQSQAIKYSRKNKRGVLVNYEWQFKIFDNIDHLQRPQLTLHINQAKILDLAVFGKEVKGEMTITSSDSVDQLQEQITLRIKQDTIPTFHDFVNLPEALENYQHQVRLFYTKNAGLLGEGCTFIISSLGLLCLPKDLKKIAKKHSEGVWVYLPIENGILLFLQEQGSVSSRTRDRGMADLLISKGAKLGDVGRHISLRQDIYYQNCSFQLKMYDFSIDESSEQTFVQYQFRQLAFNLTQKSSRILKIEDAYMFAETITPIENFAIKVKISLEFNKIKFTVSKFLDSKKVDKSEEDVEMFLKPSWKAYKEQLESGSKLSWVKVAEAIAYLCRGYLSERYRHRKPALKNTSLAIL